MKIHSNLLKITISIASAMILVGCSSAITGQNNTSNNVFDSNKCNYLAIDEKIEKDDDTILWGIQGGSLARNCLNYEKSNLLFDKAEQKYKEDVDKDNIANNIIESSASILINNNVNDYEGNTYEKVMVNTYKALNFASLNEHSNARVEFNRALDRQRRAKEFYENEIKKKKEELVKKNETDAKDIKEKQKIESINTLKVAENKDTQDVIYKKYSSLLNDFEAYPDFVNPFTTYISGIYFLLNGDSIKARDLLKESLSMDPKNKQILSDFKLSDKYITSLKKSKNNYAWIIFENGQGMVKEELRIDVPLFIFPNSKVKYTGIALPKINEKNSAYSYIEVNGKKSVNICNMDNVMKTEFKKRFPFLVTEAIMNTVTKTVVQKQLGDSGGLFGGIAGALYQGLTNKADTRSWTALPKNFQSIRVKTDKPIIIKNDKGEIISKVVVPAGKNSMIYVKSQVSGNDKIHKILF